ncbi:hypothetical protein S7711_00103 [Stachybotrys chartarum IBT 7711]|uniref:C3H1-type domain-containing protein n=1 Tax=Stachybotrys chartarum (strain CBS 109288 / IBT 7711) TaxID=1280523 RepID=A0A084B3F8_STACB|nr:hypothetical protein S7711_00103 [Stachybotrys chartarum IBT 7711]
MQSWPEPGQNGTDGHNSWQADYGFAHPNGHFDPNQAWPQPMVDQAAAYSQDGTPPNYYDPSQHQNNAFLSGNLHGNPTGQDGFHHGQDPLSLGQQYSQTGQDVVDPAFHNLHQEMFAQPGKLDIGERIGHLPQAQAHPHGHSQAFPQQNEYSFAQHNGQGFESPVTQYPQAQLLQQQTRQQSHTPVQQFEDLRNTFSPQGQGFSRPPQPSPVQHQQPYNRNQTYPAQVSGQANRFDTASPAAYQQQAYAQPSQSFVSPKPLIYTQPATAPPPQAANLAAHGQPQPIHPNTQQPISQAQQHFIPIDAAPSTTESTPTEPSPKKRKRTVTKSSAEAASAPSVAEPVLAYADSPVDPGAKRAEDIDSFETPTPSAEEANLLAQFSKRSKAVQARYPAIKGLPHLLYDGSIKLPAPKSYDKLAPLIALPPRSNKPMVPELGYPLPCELQGKFSSQYRPAMDKGGLDERRIEAKASLDDFDRSMAVLGKRRPKYTEYPHAFKEQLKSDEAAKNKLGKKVKKEMEEGQRNKPVRAVTRPMDPAEAAAWDAIGIVHLDDSTPRTSALIASRVQQAGDLVIKLRGESNRAKLDLDQAIKDKKGDAETAALKGDAEQKKEALYRALDAFVEHADDAVLDNLGGNQKLVLSLINILISSIKTTDFSGKLPKIVLELFTHFRMTKKIADTTNFDTVRKKFADKGDKEVKELIQEIAAKIKKLNRTMESEGYSGTSAAGRAKAGTTKSATDTASAKRGREEEADTRTVKKIAMEPGSSSLSKKLAQPKIQPPMAKTATPKTTLSSILPGKPRPITKPAPKPEVAAESAPVVGADDKVKAESKKPGVKAEPGKPSLDKVDGSSAVKSLAPSTSSALSGIASLLDSINAPKAETPSAVLKEVKGSDPLETPEQRSKRLRKEARRKLRVSWKPENELVQVKIFQKDDEEDEGREGNMTRDAADDRSEGMVLKQRANVDEDEEDEEIPYQPWAGPASTDFSWLPEETRKKNYVTRGGHVTFSTEEQKRIADREQRELMVIYTDLADIPSSPKSPPPETAAAEAETRIGTLPTEGASLQEIHLRWRDEQQMGVDGALYAALQRLAAKSAPSNQLDTIFGRLKGTPAATSSALPASQPAPLMPAPVRGNPPLVGGSGPAGQSLVMLQSEKIKAWRDASQLVLGSTRARNHVDPEVQHAEAAVADVSRKLAGKPYPASAPPEWMTDDEERVREWWLGYNKEMAAKQKKLEEEQARAAALVASNNTAQGNAQDWAAYYAQQQAYMAYIQQMNGAQQQPAQAAAATAMTNGQSIPDNQLQSILAAINQSSQAPQPSEQQALNPLSYLNPNDPSYQQVMMLRAMSQTHQPGPSTSTNHEQDRDRDWDRDRSDGNYHAGRGEHYKDGKDGKDGGRKKKGTLPPHKPANKALIGTKACTFWQQGKCARGDKCTFRHD